MADEEANANENIEPKQKDFYGFALYTYNARRPRSAEVEENKNGQDSEDGTVSSKIVAEGSVSDFLRKEATTNYDFRNSPGFGSFLSKDYVICLVSGSESGLDLFQKELDEYSKGLLPYIDKYTESLDVQESFKHLEFWYEENVEFVCRCTGLLKEDLAVLIGLVRNTRFCREWAKTMLSEAVDNPVFLRQVIENYKLRVNHDLNTLKRLLRQAETDHYALSYVFLLKCGNGPILLRNATLEAHALCSDDTLNIIKVLEEYIEENDNFGIKALAE
ncbi:hypothetical protein pdam_00010054 [Pocillopora damicornis]|uniref:Uncharacterized protein n=1 Tax=Pocillopora damicornis TaxID=46731 RepID=A0A3M6TSL0_POCDA|nr:hypothetical protein pdam_00010054 [Pocillopora damicornis]